MWLYEAWEQNVEWSGVGDGVEWSGVDTPQTVMTTRAPAVLINQRKLKHPQRSGRLLFGFGYPPELQSVEYTGIPQSL